MLEGAARGGASLPLSTVHLRLLEIAENAGLGELDNSAIIRVFQDRQLQSRLNEERGGRSWIMDSH
jgi:hypothetical protein